VNHAHTQQHHLDFHFPTHLLTFPYTRKIISSEKHCLSR
jgi:hypothetical protein